MTHTRTHACGANYNLPPASRAGDNKCCFEIENLVTSYKVPKDYFSKVFCIIILYLQLFQILKWRKFKSSLQNLSPLPPRLSNFMD